MAPTTDLPEAVPFSGFQWHCLDRCVAGRGGRGGGEIGGWGLFCEPFRAGETVALEQKSNLRHCHAKVQSDLIGEGEHQGCHKVEITEDDADGAGNGKVLYARPQKMARVLPDDPPRAILMTDTTNFRRVAKTQVSRKDAVLEVGCAFGDCTRVLSCHAAHVVGIDVAKELVSECRRRHPSLAFEWLDFAEEPERLKELWRSLSELGRPKIFLDIGGDRAAPDVCKVLSSLWSILASDPSLARPTMLVVKARTMAAACTEGVCDEDGIILDVPRWWASVCVQPAKSRAQLKKHRNRARKAMWAERPPDEAEISAEDQFWRDAKAKAAQIRRKIVARHVKSLVGEWRRVARDDEGDASREDGSCWSELLRWFLRLCAGGILSLQPFG